SCPTIRPRSVPVATSHKRSVLSLLPVANILPSAVIATLSTQSSCPLKLRTTLPVATSQSCTSPELSRPSPPTDTRRELSEEKTTMDAEPRRGVRRCSNLPLAVSHNSISSSPSLPERVGCAGHDASKRSSNDTARFSRYLISFWNSL